MTSSTIVTEQEFPVIKISSKEVEASDINHSEDISILNTSNSSNTSNTSIDDSHDNIVTSTNDNIDINLNVSSITEPSTSCSNAEEITDNSVSFSASSSVNIDIAPKTATKIDPNTDALVEEDQEDNDENNDKDNDENNDNEELEEESDDDSDVVLQREEGIDMLTVDIPRLLEIEEKKKDEKDFEGAARIAEYICYKLNADPSNSASSIGETLVRCGDYMLRAIEASDDFLNPSSLDQTSTTSGVPDFLGFFVMALNVYDSMIFHEGNYEGLPNDVFSGPILTNLSCDMLMFLDSLEFRRKGKETDEGVERFVKSFYNKMKKDNEEPAPVPVEASSTLKDDSKDASDDLNEGGFDIKPSSIPPTAHDIERLMYLYIRMGDGFQSIESHGQALLFYLRCFALLYITGVRDHRLLSPLISLAQELQWTGLHTLSGRVLRCYIRLLDAVSEDFKVEGSCVPESVYTSIPQSLEEGKLMLADVMRSLEKGDLIPSRLSSERQKALFNAVGDVNDNDVGTKAIFDASTVPADEVKEVRVKRKGEEREDERDGKMIKKD